MNQTVWLIGQPIHLQSPCLSSLQSDWQISGIQCSAVARQQPAHPVVPRSLLFSSFLERKFKSFLKKYIYLFGSAGSWLWHVGSLVEACKWSPVACGIQFPDQGSNPGPLHWERGVSAFRPPWESLSFFSFVWTVQHVGSLFPDQGSNLGHCSESTYHEF